MKKLLIFILLILFNIINVFADTLSVMVIMSSDLTPYKQSLSGFTQYFKDQNYQFNLDTNVLSKINTSTLYNKMETKKPDMILTIGTKATKITSKRTQKIPIIYNMIFNTERFNNPNITGISLHIPLRIKLKYIKKILPQAKRIGLIYTHKSLHSYKEAIKTCKNYNYKLITKKVTSGKDLDEAIKEIAWKIDLFIMVPDSQLYFPQSVKYLLLETLKKKIPVIGLSSIYTKAGALLSFDCHYKDMGLQAGEIAEKIVKGQTPSDIIPLSPRKVHISINTLVAERLGIKLSKTVINSAHKVYPE